MKVVLVTSTRKVMFSPDGWLIGLSLGLHDNYRTDIRETWMEEWSQLYKCLVKIMIKGHIQEFFFTFYNVVLFLSFFLR